MRVTKEDIKIYQGLGILNCPHCGDQLEIGDKLDDYFPYFFTNNACRVCEGIVKDRDLKGEAQALSQAKAGQ